MMRVVAQRGNSFLLQVGDEEGRVFDSGTGRLYPPAGLQSILARGYWEKFSGDEAAIFDELSGAHDVAMEEAGQDPLATRP